jgi:HSP20 family protein
MLPVLRSNLPISPFASAAFNRLDTLFDRFFGDEGDLLTRQGWTWSHMPLSMWTDENNLYVEVEMPGVREQDIEVTVHGDVLSIKAERKDEEGRKYLYNGRIFGRFERSVALPEAVDTDHIEATFSNGVLRLTLPKRPEARPKKITVKNV